MFKKSSEDKRLSINTKLYRVIHVLVFGTVLAGIILSAAYHLNTATRHFVNRTIQIAQANTEHYYVTPLSYTRQFLLSEETQAVRKKAEEEKNPQIYADYLSQNDTDLVITSSWVHFRMMKETYNVRDVFLAGCNDQACYFLAGPEDMVLYQGKQLPFVFNKNDNDGTAYMIRMRERDRSGENVARSEVLAYTVSGAVIPYQEGDNWDYWIVCIADFRAITRDTLSFILFMVLLFLFLSFISAMAGVSILKKQITDPIITLQNSVLKFATANAKNPGTPPEETAIDSKDEIGDLSKALFNLECNVVETQQRLSVESEDRGRIKEQLAIATDIQKGVLPQNFPEHKNYEIYAVMDPAKEVGGDFYDFFQTDDTHLVMVIGDVSDKGIPAALMMMTARTLLKTQMMVDPDPSAVLSFVNQVLCDNNPVDMFVTVWIAILDLSTGKLISSNAGHEIPMYRIGKQPFTPVRDPRGMALGALCETSYPRFELQLQPGDALFVYSDGATDACNVYQEQIGLERLTEMIRKAPSGASPKELIEHVRGKIDLWSTNMPQFDDITLMSLTYKGTPAEESEEKSDSGDSGDSNDSNKSGESAEEKEESPAKPEGSGSDDSETNSI